MGLAGTLGAIAAPVLAAATLSLAASFEVFVFDAPLAGSWSTALGRGVEGIQRAAVAVVLWLGFGALFLRYQLRSDSKLLGAARKADTGTSVTFAGLGDLIGQGVLILASGPLLIFIRAFQRPSYVYLAPDRHYRSRLFHTAGRQRAAAGQDAVIVFDSKSYLFGQLLELVFWGGLFYALFLSPGPALGA